MPRRTKTQKKRPESVAQTIPELRRAFNHIEDYGQELVCNTSHTLPQAVKSFQKEWRLVFKKDITPQVAEIYLANLKEQHTHRTPRKHTRRLRHTRSRGGMAPLMHTDRPGLYISPGVNQGSYALVPAYVDKGFWNPEQAHQYDPVPGQTSYPTRTPDGLGSNLVQQRGGQASLDQAFSQSALNQAFFRAIPSTYPPSLAQDAVSAWKGQPLGQSPDPTQTNLSYQMSPTAAPHTLPTASAINLQLKRDISTN